VVEKKSVGYVGWFEGMPNTHWLKTSLFSLLPPFIAVIGQIPSKCCIQPKYFITSFHFSNYVDQINHPEDGCSRFLQNMKTNKAGCMV
jgi:hypothetical protein